MSATMVLRVNEFVETMSTYITETNKEDMKDLKKSSFMLWGPPGVGKSESLVTIKNIVANNSGKRVIITDVRLLLFNPVDLRGIPVPDVNKEFAIWLKPYIFQMDESEDVINILMLDEISAAAPSVQASAYQITLDRKVGEHKLPDNCYVICAGNRLQDKSVAYKMPKALANRLTHFEIMPELEDWKVWAMSSGINSKIIGFLNWQPSKLYAFDPNSDENAFATPRSWAAVSNYIKIFKTLDKSYNCIAGSIGLGVAGEFKRYCEVYTELPDIKEIFAGKDVPVPQGVDILYALSSAISGHITKASKDEISNVLKYTMKMPKEFAVLTIKDILLIKGMRDKLTTVPMWVKWATEYKCLIV